MGYFAKLNQDKIVEEVISINNEVLREPEISFPNTEIYGQNFIKDVLLLDGEWKQTSYNKSFRKNYASVGFSYDSQLDAFLPPKPFPSWILNQEICDWYSPVPYPSDGKKYQWDESVVGWVEV